jgi:hypothetical protein
MGEIVNMPCTSISFYCICFWNCAIDIDNYRIKILLLILVKPVQNRHTENLLYDILQYKIPSVLFQENFEIYCFFLLLSVSDHYKPIVPFCVRVYPSKWHETDYFSVKLVKIEIMFWENNMKLSISQWNWWKIEIMFWETDMKLIWNQVFLCEIGEKSRLCLKLIISELCQFVNLKWLQFKKSQFMTVFIQIFIKKDLDIKFKSVLFRELSFSYRI